MALKLRDHWYSGHLHEEVTVVRWGHFGKPVIVFPTAGGDAEEIQRMWLVDAVGDFLEAGRGKTLFCGNAGRAPVPPGGGGAPPPPPGPHAVPELAGPPAGPPSRTERHRAPIPRH